MPAAIRKIFTNFVAPKQPSYMERIEQEKTVVSRMIAIYCRRHHASGDALCEECRRLLDYALRRLDHCPKGDAKTSCRKCEIHCYRPQERAQIRAVMKYVGPRMLFIAPLSALRHLANELK